MWREFIRIGEAVLRREREAKAGSPVQQTPSGTLTPSSMETPGGESRALDLEAGRAARSAAGSAWSFTGDRGNSKTSANPRPPLIDDLITIDQEEGTMTITGGTGQPVKIMLDSVLQTEENIDMKEINASVRMTKREQVEIRKAARAAGQTASFFMRECIKKELRRAETPPIENVKEQINDEINRLLRMMIKKEKESA